MMTVARTHPTTTDCFIDPIGGLSPAMGESDPGEGGTGRTVMCRCGRAFTLVGRAGFVFWSAEEGD